MNVADFQKLTKSLAAAFAADSTKVEKELLRLSEGLEPFQDLSIAEFTDFLAKADEYSRTGIVPTKSVKTRSASINHQLVEESVKDLQLLFEEAVQAQTSYSVIQSRVKLIGKPLKKNEAVELAKQFGITEAVKSKKEALEKIESRIARRKEGHDHLTSVRDM